MSDIAKKSGIERPSLYRAFSCGPTGPNFKTVLSVLDAMGFRLKVTVRRGGRSKQAPLICINPVAGHLVSLSVPSGLWSPLQQNRPASLPAYFTRDDVAERGQYLAAIGAP